MKIELKKPDIVHTFEVGDLFKTRAGSIRMIVSTHNYYETVCLGGITGVFETSLGLLMNHYPDAEFIGRLEIKD